MSRVETNTLISWLSHPNCTPQRHFENHSYCLVTNHFWELGCLNANLPTHTLCTHIYEVHKLVNSIALTLSSVCYGAYSSSYYKLSRTNLTLFQLRGRFSTHPWNLAESATVSINRIMPKYGENGNLYFLFEMPSLGFAEPNSPARETMLVDRFRWAWTSSIWTKHVVKQPATTGDTKQPQVVTGEITELSSWAVPKFLTPPKSWNVRRWNIKFLLF